MNERVYQNSPDDYRPSLHEIHEMIHDHIKEVERWTERRANERASVDRLEVERIYQAVLAIGDSELRYLVDEGKYLETASRIVEEASRFKRAGEVA
jgi:hypothetical protein